MISSLFQGLAATASLSAATLLTTMPCAADAAMGQSFRAADPPRVFTGQAPAGGRWYERFHDDTLSALENSAAERTPLGHVVLTDRPLGEALPSSRSPSEAEADVAGNYVVARTTAVRLMLLHDVQTTLRRERGLIAASPPLSATGGALARVDALLRASSELGESMDSRRRASASRLAALCGSTPEAIEALLRAAPQPTVLPVFDTGSLADAGFDALRVRAGADVLQLERMAGAASRAEELARARAEEFRAMAHRNKLGDASEMDVITAYRRLLAGNDALAVAGADLALGWIELASKIGGASLAADHGERALSSEQR